MIPTWLRRHLETTTGAPLGARYARATLCPHCGALTLTGLDAELLAFPARVDPHPLTPDLEVAALVAGRETYDAAHTAGRATLTYRDRWRTKTPPSPTHLVLPEHRCATKEAS